MRSFTSHQFVALPLSCHSPVNHSPPTNILTNSEADRVKNGTLASSATALASSVLPAPGGPTCRMPLGILPPRCWKRIGSFRNPTISTSSAIASSTSATSAKVVWVFATHVEPRPTLAKGEEAALGSRHPPTYPPEEQDHHENGSEEKQDIQPEITTSTVGWQNRNGHVMLLQKRNQIVITELGHGIVNWVEVVVPFADDTGDVNTPVIV